MATWRQTVFSPIKDQNFAVNTHCRNNVRVLWLISSFIDFARVINLLHYIHLNGWRVARRRVAIATNLASLVIVVSLIWCDIFRKFYVGDLEVIRCIV